MSQYVNIGLGPVSLPQADTVQALTQSTPAYVQLSHYAAKTNPLRTIL